MELTERYRELQGDGSDLYFLGGRVFHIDTPTDVARQIIKESITIPIDFNTTSNSRRIKEILYSKIRYGLRRLQIVQEANTITDMIVKREGYIAFLRFSHPFIQRKEHNKLFSSIRSQGGFFYIPSILYKGSSDYDFVDIPATRFYYVGYTRKGGNPIYYPNYGLDITSLIDNNAVSIMRYKHEIEISPRS